MQVISFPRRAIPDEVVHEWAQGMPHGLPGTDLLNWVFNHVYDSLAGQIAYDLLRRQIIARTTKQGDDLWKKTRSVIDRLDCFVCILDIYQH